MRHISPSLSHGKSKLGSLLPRVKAFLDPFVDNWVIVCFWVEVGLTWWMSPKWVWEAQACP
jgi:hypothetical protein